MKALIVFHIPAVPLSRNSVDERQVAMSLHFIAFAPRMDNTVLSIVVTRIMATLLYDIGRGDTSCVPLWP